MDVPIPEALIQTIKKRINSCKQATASNDGLLFLNYPTEARGGVKRYYLDEPETLDHRGLALGLDEIDNRQWWTVLAFPEGVSAYLTMRLNDDCLVTIDAKTNTRLSWHATASNGGERILQRFVRVPTAQNEPTNDGPKGPKYSPTYSFTTHGLFICCVANERMTVNRTEPGKTELLGTISNHARTLKSARPRDKLTPSDCVVNPSFGEHHIHIALILTVIRMWFLGWDFRSGG
jgi:hypothetical protein